MPPGYLSRKDVADIVHELAERSSIITASLDYLDQQKVVLPGQCGEALQDATAAAKQLADAVRTMQALLG